MLEARLDELLRELIGSSARGRVIGFCWPFRAEFDARPLVERYIGLGLRACLPVVCGPGTPLLFREWQPGCEMFADRYGIQTPKIGETLHPDFLLLPVNAFDVAGYRLGYGAGYFDRTLTELDPLPLIIGMGFELARIETIRPEAHDIPLDMVITEKDTEWFCKAKTGFHRSFGIIIAS